MAEIQEIASNVGSRRFCIAPMMEGRRSNWRHSLNARSRRCRDNPPCLYDARPSRAFRQIPLVRPGAAYPINPTLTTKVISKWRTCEGSKQPPSGAMPLNLAHLLLEYNAVCAAIRCRRLNLSCADCRASSTSDIPSCRTNQWLHACAFDG